MLIINMLIIQIMEESASPRKQLMRIRLCRGEEKNSPGQIYIELRLSDQATVIHR